MSSTAPTRKTQIPLFPDDVGIARVESFDFPTDDVVRRQVERRDGNIAATEVPAPPSSWSDPESAFDLAWLQLSERPAVPEAAPEVRFVDLFSGCGALSLGVWEACRALGCNPAPLLGVDTNPAALEAYADNFPEASISDDPVESVLDGDPGDEITPTERKFLDRMGPVHLLVGGPPCQGHSDLNNHTRRRDPKNRLYLRMARFAEVFSPQHLIIENVPGAVHDRGGVVQETIGLLHELGYHVEAGVIKAQDLGVPQRRRRFFTIASKTVDMRIDSILARSQRPPRPVGWAIEDLLDVVGEGIFDTSANHSSTNRERIRYLFDHDLYELPDSQRPDCHRLKPHSYRSVYGRMRWEDQAPTITTGFGSTGQGRFVHPKRPRTLTPHEAARVQFLPDFFRYGSAPGRGAYQEMIGNAVPPKIAYAIALELLR